MQVKTTFKRTTETRGSPGSDWDPSSNPSEVPPSRASRGAAGTWPSNWFPRNAYAPQPNSNLRLSSGYQIWEAAELSDALPTAQMNNSRKSSSVSCSDLHGSSSKIMSNDGSWIKTARTKGGSCLGLELPVGAPASRWIWPCGNSFVVPLTKTMTASRSAAWSRSAPDEPLPRLGAGPSDDVTPLGCQRLVTAVRLCASQWLPNI